MHFILHEQNEIHYMEEESVCVCVCLTCLSKLTNALALGLIESLTNVRFMLMCYFKGSAFVRSKCLKDFVVFGQLYFFFFWDSNFPQKYTKKHKNRRGKHYREHAKIPLKK